MQIVLDAIKLTAVEGTRKRTSSLVKVSLFVHSQPHNAFTLFCSLYNHPANSGQYFFTIVFLFTLPMALRSIASTSFSTVGTLYAAISCLSCARRLPSSSGSVCVLMSVVLYFWIGPC